jgi:hypothetical protein
MLHARWPALGVLRYLKAFGCALRLGALGGLSLADGLDGFDDQLSRKDPAVAELGAGDAACPGMVFHGLGAATKQVGNFLSVQYRFQSAHVSIHEFVDFIESILM